MEVFKEQLQKFYKFAIKNVTEYCRGFYEKYGILGIISIVMVAFKVILFYKMMEISNGIIDILVISFLVIYTFFKCFSNKFISLILYTLISIVMFGDITYYSFFNKYLSFQMIGSVGVVGSISASIKDLLGTNNFMMFIDILVIFITLIVSMKKGKLRINENKSIVKVKNAYNYIGKKLILPVLVFTLMSVTSFSSTYYPYFQSISKQEFFTYHLGDAAAKVFDVNQLQNVMPFEDHYMNEKQGELFGVAKNRNLIVIQIESFQNFLINREYNGQEITPFLNSLLQEDTVYFDNYYQQVGTGNTSDAEFESNNGYMGSIESFTYKLYEDNYYRGLPVLLKEKGYDVAVFHAHEDKNFWNRKNAYPALGFDKFYGGLIGPDNGDYKMTKWMGWGLVDSEFFPQSVKYMKTLKEPFYSFLISLSNHHPYEMIDEYKTIKLKPQDEDTTVGNYINSAAYTDRAIKEFVEELKINGMYENSIIAMYGDHMGLPGEEEIKKSMDKLLGHEYRWNNRMNIPLIIHIPNCEKDIKQTIHNPGGQIDFMPTIAYLMGFDKLDTIYLGHNLFNYRDGIIAEHAYLPYGSFFTEKYGFQMYKDGIFQNGKTWDLKTGEKVNDPKLYEKHIKAKSISDTSIFMLENDVIRKVYKEGIPVEKVMNSN